MSGPSRAQRRLVALAAALTALLAGALAVAFFAEGGLVLAAAAVLVVLVSALPLALHGITGFRVAAGAAALAVLAAGLLTALAGGYLLWPMAFLLAVAATARVRWSAMGALIAGALGVAAQCAAAGSAYVAYSCLRPEPFLDVRFAELPSATRLNELIEAERVRTREARGDATYRVTFERGAGGERNALARRLRGHAEVVAVEAGDERCD